MAETQTSDKSLPNNINFVNCANCSKMFKHRIHNHAIQIKFFDPSSYKWVIVSIREIFLKIFNIDLNELNSEISNNSNIHLCPTCRNYLKEIYKNYTLFVQVRNLNSKISKLLRRNKQVSLISQSENQDIGSPVNNLNCHKEDVTIISHIPSIDQTSITNKVCRRSQQKKCRTEKQMIRQPIQQRSHVNLHPCNPIVVELDINTLIAPVNVNTINPLQNSCITNVIADTIEQEILCNLQPQNEILVSNSLDPLEVNPITTKSEQTTLVKRSRKEKTMVRFGIRQDIVPSVEFRSGAVSQCDVEDPEQMIIFTEFSDTHNDDNTNQRKFSRYHKPKKNQIFSLFKCRICPRRYTSDYYLTKHMCSYHQWKKLKCSFCTKIFCESSALENHKLLKHPTACLICSKVFRSPVYLLRHKYNVHGKSSYRKCTVCEKVVSRSGFVGHMRTHTGEKPYLCSVCGKSFSGRAYFRWHFNLHFGMRLRNHKCDFCEKSFRTRNLLNDHKLMHAENPSRDYMCEICGKTFTMKHYLYVHKLYHQSAKEKPQKCPYCIERYSSKYGLTCHLQSKTHNLSLAEARKCARIVNQKIELVDYD